MADERGAPPGRAPEGVPARGWRRRLHEVIFEAEDFAGQAFDLALLAAIVLSILAVLLESVPTIRATHGTALRTVEWIFTGLFTVEYVLRLISVERPLRYARSFYGIVDLLSILPTWLSVVMPGTQSFLVIRALRLLRVFRVLKLARFVGEARYLVLALRASGRKITVFLGTVITIALIAGAAMYLVEGAEHGFTSIPKSMYWAIVTMTTVGYGDIAPGTIVGRFLASMLMILGYGIIAVPTGIVTVEMAAAFRRPVSTEACPSCGAEGHEPEARFCNRCGAAL
jgi:voltage-gated potassium channel